ncbi:translin-like [Gigantopelta aegis]|uniref:translin-like n=1 Tax=Gigantopelta aegis TaxID=1735272 RepID=UPI001B887DE4|nr:translin-like [Gigantopelta aegis]
MSVGAKPGIFSDFQEYLNADHQLREEIRTVVHDIEQTAREIQTKLQLIHQAEGIKKVSTICKEARDDFSKVRDQIAKLAEKIPNNQYYRFHDQWRFVLQRLTSLAALITYLETETLIGRDEAAAMIGVKVKRDDGFHIDLDDYLMGLLQVATELSRLAITQ